MKTLTANLMVTALVTSTLAAQSSISVDNISSRGLVGQGSNVQILGIAVSGNPGDYRPVLLRGLGPLLGEFGVDNFIEDPRISLFAGEKLIASNDNWTEGNQTFALTATGFSPHYEQESALIALLSPGTYTMHLSSQGNTGVGLNEAYFLDEKTLPENLLAAGSFQTLLAAVQAAGLAETLAGPGPFTLFAPTDEAFSSLPAGTVESLLGDIPALTNILLYHAVAGREILSSQVADGPVMMANGIPANLTTGNGVKIDDANIIEVDWLGSNGVIHVIDSVLLPPPSPSSRTIVENLVAQGSFSTLVTAVQAADLGTVLNGAGPFTLFAPTDAAFAELPAGTLQTLLGNIPALRDILLYHVIGGVAVNASSVMDGTVSMANGASATLGTDDGVTINDARVTGPDWISSNGIIHIIDKVILPPSP